MKKTKTKSSRSLARRVSCRMLAARIARKLFTPGGSRTPAQQLRLMRDGAYVCGWGLGPATDAIEKILEAANNQAQARPEKP